MFYMDGLFSLSSISMSSSEFEGMLFVGNDNSGSSDGEAISFIVSGFA